MFIIKVTLIELNLVR